MLTAVSIGPRTHLEKRRRVVGKRMLQWAARIRKIHTTVDERLPKKDPTPQDLALRHQVERVAGLVEFEAQRLIGA